MSDHAWTVNTETGHKEAGRGQTVNKATVP